MNRALGLFGCGELPPVAEHVDAGKVKGAVGTHGFPQCGGLGHQSGLFHHMSGKGNAVLTAPGADIVCKSRGKPLADMVVVMITVYGNRALGKLPDTFGKTLKEIAVVSLFIGLRKIIRKGQDDFFLFLCKP